MHRGVEGARTPPQPRAGRSLGGCADQPVVILSFVSMFSFSFFLPSPLCEEPAGTSTPHSKVKLQEIFSDLAIPPTIHAGHHIYSRNTWGINTSCDPYKCDPYGVVRRNEEASQ